MKEILLENLDINETKVFIGPHIRQCCYEVSYELKEAFIKKTKIKIVELNTIILYLSKFSILSFDIFLR